MVDTTDNAAEEWKLRGSQLFPYIALIPLLLSSIVYRTVRTLVTAPGDLGDVMFEAIVTSVYLALGILAVVVVVRTGVRLIADGLEVRQLRTRLYRWAEIKEIKPDRFDNDRTIRVVLHNGTDRRLPAPAGPPLKESPNSVRDAAALMQRRLEEHVGPKVDEGHPLDGFFTDS